MPMPCHVTHKNLKSTQSPRYWNNHNQPTTHFDMGRLWREVNIFFSSTTIHGFQYISNTQSKSTRLIWTVIVLAGFVANSYFLYSTVGGFSDKYVTTTVETRSIQEFPFPAITFHPSEYNSKDALKRHFFNQFEFTRYIYPTRYQNPYVSPTVQAKKYNDSTRLKDNEKFQSLYQWLVNPMHDELFNDVERFLVTQGKYIEKEFVWSSGMNSDYYKVCALVALNNRNISLKQEIRSMFLTDIYKNISVQLLPTIQQAISKQFLTYQIV